MRRYLTNLQVRAIRRDYAAGNDVYTVAEWHGVGAATAMRYTKDIRRPRHNSKIDKGELRRLVQAGETRAAIARHFKCSWAAVHDAIKRLDDVSAEMARAA